MRHEDALYGTWEIPEILHEFIGTPEIQRLHGISQDVLPRGLVPWKMASRFEHSMGVARLASLVIRENKEQLTQQQQEMLLLAALYHDAGNAALSHLSEPFLKALTGKDGESFLEERLHESVSASLMQRHQIAIHDVVRMVTGKAAPLSKVLNGSIDVDNLDNVGRYWFTAHSGEVLFLAQLIASSYRLQDNGWASVVFAWRRREDGRTQGGRCMGTSTVIRILLRIAWFGVPLISRSSTGSFRWISSIWRILQPLISSER